MPSPVRMLRRLVAALLDTAATTGFVIVCVPAAVIARLLPKRIDVGLGPEPLINNVYHKQALTLAGYSAETFVDHVYFITSEFDYRGDLAMPGRLGFLRAYVLMLRCLFRYRAIYLYFNGGPLQNRRGLWRIEPLLFRLAGTKVVVMPYGGDVQDMTRSRNLPFKHALAADYPAFKLRRRRVRAQLDLWTRHADHVISGVEWVDYMYHWDTLMLGHFSIDTDRWKPDATPRRPGPVRVLHAPNHRNIKGTRHVMRAVDELRAEGVDVELVLLEGVPNDRIRDAVADADIVVDQLVVGWYAMFALEAMALGKPVVCYLRDDLVRLYACAGLVREGEIPLVSAGPAEVKAAIRTLVTDEPLRAELGTRGRRFVETHHSLAHVASVMAEVNRSVGLLPSLPLAAPSPGEVAPSAPTQESA